MQATSNRQRPISRADLLSSGVTISPPDSDAVLPRSLSPAFAARAASAQATTPVQSSAAGEGPNAGNRETIAPESCHSKSRIARSFLGPRESLQGQHHRLGSALTQI